MWHERNEETKKGECPQTVALRVASEGRSRIWHEWNGGAKMGSVPIGSKLNPLGAAIGTDGLGGVFTSAPTPLATPHNISAICFCRQRGYSILPPLSDARRLCGY
jgi:hypothetical protein